MPQTVDSRSAGDAMTNDPGVVKGYKMLARGHVLKLEFNGSSETPGQCFVRCKVVASMKKKMYTVRLCLSHLEDIKFGLCSCAASLADPCNHIAALAYALEDCVRRGLRQSPT